MCSALLILALTPTALANPAEANEQVPDAAELPTPPVEGSEQPERTTEEPSTPDTALEDEPGDVTTAPPTPPPGPVHVQTPGWPDADVETARRALDERLEPDERLQALEALREGYGPDATWLLRSTARERDLSLQLPIIDMLASSEDHEDQDVLRWVITDLESDWDARSAAMDRLVAQSNRGAGRLLWTLSSQPAVPGILRARASAALREKYPEILAELGEPRAVSDALGGLAFTVGWGVAGGTALSSLGTWGRFDGGPAIGGVGGSLTGMGLAGYSLTRAPRTTGQGTALLSGTSWGLTTSLWASDAIYGRGGAASRSWDAYDNGSAAIRMAGVAGGTALGMYWQSTKPTGWDVMEVNMATYLGSAMALSGTALALWRPEYAWWSRWEPNSRARIRAERIMDASNIAGAAAGLGAGLALQRTWDLDERDLLFSMVVGGEAAWIGGWMPTALGIEGGDLKGNVRLPWNAGIAAGLAIAELHPMSVRTSAVGQVSAVAGNMLGAGVPLMLSNNPNEQVVAGSMIATGAAATAAGITAADWLAPEAGDWAMTTVTTGLANYNVGAIAAAAELDSDRTAGLLLSTSGTSMAGSLVAGHFFEPRTDDMLAISSATAWGTFYGSLTPVAANLDLDDRYRPLVAVLTSDAFSGGMAIALAEPIGLQPRQLVMPQLMGLSGATVGALGTGMFTQSGERVAAGALVGATLGLGLGGWLESRRSPSATQARRTIGGLPALPGQWSPSLAPTVVDGEPGVYVGITGQGW